jgi:hypothetical protein
MIVLILRASIDQEVESALRINTHRKINVIFTGREPTGDGHAGA